MNINKILHPTDFSDCSKKALDHALLLAEQYDAELHLYHATVLHDADPASAEEHFPEGGEILERLLGLASSRLSGWLPKERRGVAIREVVERGYSAAPMIIDYAEREDVDLVVMGTHGHGALGRLFLGSVADRVVRHAPCPVLTVREAELAAEMKPFERILVPVDFSDHSRVALAHAREIASTYGARLQLLHVVQMVTYPTLYGTMGSVFDLENLKKRSLVALERWMGETPGPEVGYDKHVHVGRPGIEIAAFAKDHDSDLIVIPTHGLSGLERMLSGSTAEEVVRHARCPVLTLKSLGKSLVDFSTEETTAVVKAS